MNILWLWFLLAVTYGTRDLVELVNESFGSVKSERPKQWPTPHSLNSSLELAKIIQQVMLGNVDPMDSIITKMDDAKKTIKKIMRELEGSTREKDYNIMDHKSSLFAGVLASRSRMHVEHVLQRMEYNVSKEQIDGIGSYCNSSHSSPNAILTKIFEDLLGKCNRTLTYADYSRYAETLSILERTYVPGEILTFREKAKVAFDSMIREERPQTVVDKFVALKEKLRTDPYYEYNNVMNAIQNRTYVKEPFCAYHSEFYKRGCNKRGLEAVIDVVDNLLRNVMIGTVLCGAAKDDDEKRRTFFESTIAKIKDIQAFQSRIYSTYMNSTFDTCDVSWIKEAINNFKPKGMIEEADYQRLANETIDFLMFKGNRQRQMYIVVSRNHDIDRNYLPICPKQQCKIITNSLRNVTIFYTVHDTVYDRQIERNDDFFANSSKKIESIVKENSGADKIETIRKALNGRNLTLSGEGRFEKELWLRHWTRIGDCQFKTALATNSESKNYELKQFYARNLLRFSPCQNYFVYVFP